MSQSGTGQLMNNDYQQTMLANTLKQADDMQMTIDSMTQMQSITLEIGRRHAARWPTRWRTRRATPTPIRDHLADFDDFFRPLRNYFYWEPHCFDIPMCWSIRSIFDTLDGINTMSDDFQDLVPDIEQYGRADPADWRP